MCSIYVYVALYYNRVYCNYFIEHSEPDCIYTMLTVAILLIIMLLSCCIYLAHNQASQVNLQDILVRYGVKSW